MEKENNKDKENEKEKNWYVYDSYFRCYGNPRDSQWKFEKRKNDLHRHGDASGPSTQNMPLPTGNRQLPPLPSQNRPRPQPTTQIPPPPRRNPVTPTAYYAGFPWLLTIRREASRLQLQDSYRNRRSRCPPPLPPDPLLKVEEEDSYRITRV